MIIWFQLTRSRGAWHIVPKTLHFIFHFNSHAHVERDQNQFREASLHHHFNSHAHVERDILLVDIFLVSNISTHTLTWSVTSLCYFSILRWEIFQLTRSRGAWQGMSIEFIGYFGISTHTLTWSVTYYLIRNGWNVLFQLTRSRGAWRKTYAVCEQEINFNSHAHVERDWKNAISLVVNLSFQLTRSRGAWPISYRRM